ncbi:receptor-like protein 7 [Quercus suber]|uniref:Receptor-like protein 7 n=1 Tax=Quercus suber TaxID=58331 RepID=A0AAW0JAC4_QUESU
MATFQSLLLSFGPLESSMFSKLKTLYTIDISHNPLLSFNNYSIDLHLLSCNISGFPDFIKSMESLEELDLSNNQIKGNIPIHFPFLALRGFDEREIVHLLVALKIGKIGYEFIQKHLYDFKGLGQPDPTRASDFLTDMRMRYQDSNRTTTQPSS